MCKPHWNQYTAGLARDAKARKAAGVEAESADAATVETKPCPAKGKAKAPIAVNEGDAAE